MKKFYIFNNKKITDFIFSTIISMHPKMLLLNYFYIFGEYLSTKFLTY